MSNELNQVGRRAFLRNGALFLGASALPMSVAAMASAASQDSENGGGDKKKSVRFGMVTDLHYADKRNGGSRHYRESIQKLGEAVTAFNGASIDFVVELGDFIDAAPSVKQELGYLKTINKVFGGLNCERHYVLGNHCVTTLKKQEFLDGVERENSYYSFDRDDIHFVVLDACFRQDGEPYGNHNFKWTDTAIPKAELEWLQSDLAKTKKKTVVFAHQRLDVANAHGVKNSAAVRKILEDAGNVVAVFQGHSHKNDYRDIQGIHYCTMVAMVEGSGKESSGYSVLEVNADGSIKVDGFRKQADYSWT